MLLCEADGKRLLARHGVPVPRGEVLNGDEAGTRQGVVKAQVLSGGRKLGQLVSVDHENTADAGGGVSSNSRSSASTRGRRLRVASIW